MLGKNPITSDPVPQTAKTLIGGFMKLIGQEDIWENMKRANAINRAFAWFKNPMAALLGFIGEIPTLFINALKSLKIEDLLVLPGAFMRIAGMFGDFVGHFISWASHAVWNLLEIIFDVVSPGALAYVKKTGAALKSILKSPIPFVRNLVRAPKLGFNNFKDKFGEHLKAGLIDWLTGSLPGVYIRKALTLAELGRFALSVLGITWAQIRGKIVKALGPTGERIMTALETGFDIVVALVKGGALAAWELIKDKLTNLTDLVIDGIIGFVNDTIVKKAILELVSMLIPGAAFISAILAIYDTAMVFVQKLAKIAAAVMAFVDSIVAVAAGQVEAAAHRVEAGLASLISLAISFLAGFLGLVNVGEKVLGVIKKVAAVVDKALDTVVGWVVGKAKGLFAKLFGKRDKKDTRTDSEKDNDKAAAIADAEKLLSQGDFEPEKVRGAMVPIKERYKLLTLNLVIDSEKDQLAAVHFTASASEETVGKPKEVKLATAAGTPVPAGAWIKLPDGSVEQVAASASVVRRRAARMTPISFGTDKPDGGTNTHLYADEHQKWERTDFCHQSKYVVPLGQASFALRPQYRDGTYIRVNFYLDNQSHRDKMVASKLPGLSDPTDPKSPLSEAPYDQEAAKGYTKKVNGRASVPRKEASPDHDPPIAAHWTSTGNDQKQKSRESWNASPTTYKIISRGTQYLPRGQGAMYTEKVGINFTGPGDP